jgi:hypothetical protein
VIARKNVSGKQDFKIHEKTTCFMQKKIQKYKRNISKKAHKMGKTCIQEGPYIKYISFIIFLC